MRALIVTALAAVSLTACGEREPNTAASPDAPDATPGAPATTGDQPAAAGPAVQSEVREFRDWRAVCDNGNRCVAWTGGDGGWVRVMMEPGPLAAPSVSGGSWALGQQDETPRDLALQIDGQTHTLRPSPANAANAAAGEARSRAILTALAAAKSVAITGNGQSEALPSAGASAALLWIDERQGRLNTTTALLRRGDRPASAVPAPPALPRVIAAPPINQGALANGGLSLEDEKRPRLTVPAAIEALPDVRKCRAEEDNAAVRDIVLAVKLGPEKELWGVTCGAGAYNVTYRLYVTGPNGTNPRSAELPTRQPITEGDIGMGAGWLVNPVYDTRRQTLTVFPRGRGLGDCGTITSWTWTGQAFALNEERFMGDCWGMSDDLWPTTWRTRG